MAAKIVVHRDSIIDIKIRGLDVILDGKVQTDLAYGERAEYELEPGPHKLTVSNRLYSKSIDFEAREGEVVAFTVGNKRPSLWAALLIVIGFAPYRVFLEQD